MSTACSCWHRELIRCLYVGPVSMGLLSSVSVEWQRRRNFGQYKLDWSQVCTRSRGEGIHNVLHYITFTHITVIVVTVIPAVKASQSYFLMLYVISPVSSSISLNQIQIYFIMICDFFRFWIKSVDLSIQTYFKDTFRYIQIIRLSSFYIIDDRLQLCKCSPLWQRLDLCVCYLANQHEQVHLAWLYTEEAPN